ncbi:ATP-binding protein [Marinobacter salicampi]|uniref:ATP-binding protein n=1 Tax=Marinobacter salicampi TaxID=435907 RepID=UPI00140E8B2A|nr:ATP-binding protein [Marinobacter salicampi]
MTLKRQLLIASLLMLLIPWAGLQFVLELDQALRAQAAQQLQSQASRMQTGARKHLPDTDQRPAIYATTVERQLNLDGYGDDWPGYDEEDAETVPSGQPADWQIAVNGDHLYLLLRVANPNPRYFDPGQPNRAHEHLRIYWRDGGELKERHIQTPAPGPVVGWRPGRQPAADYQVRGYWQATGRGYQLELRLPRPGADQAFGFMLHRPDPVTGDTRAVTGTGSPPELPRLVTRSAALEDTLASAILPGQQVLVLDTQGWVLAQEALSAPDSQPDFESLGAMDIIEQISLNILRALVRHFQPDPIALPENFDRLDPSQLPEQGIVRHGTETPQLMVHRALDDGRHLVLEQSLSQLVALSGDALGSVIARSTLLILALMLALLGYASWLSWRITRLQQAVRGSIDTDGRVIGPMPASAARDELGDLSRQFSQMIDNLQGYTRYLESFSRRLSHELKTPVAVMRSSLDNLAQEDSRENQDAYLQRAQQATDRLSQILQGMSEAARLEQSFDHAEKEAFDMAVVVSQATAAYQALSPDHRILYRGPDAGAAAYGSPELLVQLLDKLVDNARDFTPPGGLIEVAVTPGPGGNELSVFNEGSSLPAHLTSEIFSPFVSLRDRADQGHLGQGLLIVRLIAEYHQGSVQADNADSPRGPQSGRGVIFRIWLPLP